MALTFRGTAIPGTHGRMQFGNWGVQAVRTTYFGLAGTSELRGERTGRELVMESWFHNSFATAALLEAAIETLNRSMLTNGKIVQTGAIARTLQRCTFEGIKITDGPLPSNTIGYWAQVEIRWFQLGP
jgi:hypothetical protein